MLPMTRKSVDNLRLSYHDEDDFRHDVMLLKRCDQRCTASTDAGNNSLVSKMGGGKKSSENVGRENLNCISDDIDDDFNEYINLLSSRELELSCRELELLSDDGAVCVNKEGIGNGVNIGAEVAADTNEILESSVNRKFMRADNDKEISDLEYMEYLRDLDPHLFSASASEPAANEVVTAALEAAKGNDCIVDTVSNDYTNGSDCNGDLDDTDPHYQKFLDNVRVDGPLYILEIFLNDQVSQILKYEIDDKTDCVYNADDLGGILQCTLRDCKRTKRVVSDKGAAKTRNISRVDKLNVCQSVRDIPRVETEGLQIRIEKRDEPVLARSLRICKPANIGSTGKDLSLKNEEAGVARTEGKKGKRTSLLDSRICKPANKGLTGKDLSLKNKEARVARTEGKKRKRTSLLDTRICKPANKDKGSTGKDLSIKNEEAGVARTEGEKRKRTSLLDTRICKPANKGSTGKDLSLKNEEAGVARTEGTKGNGTSLLDTRICKPANEGSTVKDRSLKNKKAGVARMEGEKRRRTSLLNDFSVNRGFGCTIKEEIVDEIPSVYANPLKKDGKHVVFNTPINVKLEYEDDQCSTDSEMIILDTDSVYAHLNRTPFETTKSLVLIDDGKPGDTNSPFYHKLLEILRKPYDEQEYEDLSKRASKRKPIERERNLRGRYKLCPTRELGLSNLDQYEDFARVFDEAQGDKPKQLKLLRGYFYWMEKHVVKGAFKPWLDSSL